MVSGRRRLVSIAATGALGACCLGAVGCSSSSSSGASDPLTNLTGAQVVAEAHANLKAAPTVTAVSTSFASGQYMTISGGFVAGKGCTVTVMLGMAYAGGSLTYITLGQTIYFKMDDTMWQGIAGANATTITQYLGGKYIKDSLSDPKLHVPYVGNCEMTDEKAWAGPVAKGQVTTLNGVQVLPLKNSRGDVLYVTDTSKPEEVQMDAAPLPGTTEPAGESAITVGAPVKLTPPPASQVVSGAALGL